ncbi:MAG: type IV pilus assembly protein PilM [bacterium]
MKKEDEIAATNKLLRLIRGEKDPSESTPPRDIPNAGKDGGSDEELPERSPILKSNEYDDSPELSGPSALEEEEESRFADGLADSTHPDFPADPNRGEGIPDRQEPPDVYTLQDTQRKRKPRSERTEEDASDSVSSFPSSQSQQFLSAAAQPGEEIYRKQGEIKGNNKFSLGLDIGSRYIKYVQIQRRMNKCHLIAWGIIKNSHHTPGDWSSVAGTLRGLFGGNSLAHSRIISAVGGSSVIVRHIKFPPLSNKEIEESIRWEAKSYVPFPLRDVNIDYQILGRSTKNKQTDVLLVAVTKKLLQDHLDMLQSIQIKPSVIDINSLALVNAFSANNPGRDERAVVLLDIGSSTTILNIYKKDDLYLTRDIPIAGDAFTHAIQKEKRLSFEEAETAKHDKKFDLNIIRPVLDNLTREIRRSLIYYDNQTSRRGFGRIVLTGGSSRLSGLLGYLSEELGLAVEIANPFQAVQIDPRKFTQQDELQFFSPQMALALGLASRVA